MNFANPSQRVVDVDITVAEGIITVRGLLTCVSVTMIEFTKVNGEEMCLNLADEDLRDNSVQGFRIITDEDDVMEFVTEYNMNVADKEIARLAKIVNASFDQIAEYLPETTESLIEVLSAELLPKKERN